jgi:outer membrane protein TolC
MKPTFIILIVLTAFINLTLTAGDDAVTRRLSLKEAQDYAVAHSTETENARIDVQMARKKTWETTAIGLPQISGQVSYTNMLKIPTTLIPAKFFDPDAADDEFIDVKFGTQHNASLELTVSQLVFNGSYIVGLQAAKVYQQLSKNQLEKKEIDIRETIANTYYLILMAEKNLAILQETRENLKQSLFEIEEMLKAGFCEESDVDQVRLSLTDLDTMFSSTRRQVDMAHRLLKFQMGLELESRVELTETLDGLVSVLAPPVSDSEGFDITRHIDFRVMQTMEQSMALLLKKEKSEFLPTVTAFLSYSQSAMRDQFNFFSKDEKWFPSSVLGLNVSLPLFSSGQRLARVAQANLEWQKARNQKDQVADGLKLALEQARSDYQDAFAREKSTSESLALAKRIYENSRAKFNKGMIDTMTLTQVHNQYLNAESAHTQALVSLLTAGKKLDKALNRL